MSDADVTAILAEIEKIKKEEYKRGFEAGRKSVANDLIALGQRLTSLSSSSHVPWEKVRERHRNQPSLPLSEKPGYRPGTTIEKVHNLVKSAPGLTGVQIYETLHNEYPDTEERTVRTSLARLKKKWGGHIINRGGKWYPKNHNHLL